MFGFVDNIYFIMCDFVNDLVDINFFGNFICGCEVGIDGGF